MIYADNAATTKLDIDAFEAMKPFLLENYGNASQPYSFGVKAKKAINEARKTIAECIGAEPEEIYFTSGGTESDNWAIKMGSKVVKNDGNIITSQIEHHAILNACAALEKTGIEVKYLPVTHEAVVLPETLSQMISEKTSLVSVMMANNEVGSIQPIKELADIAHTNGALFHTDAVQAVGHIEIDVKALGVDMFSASAHKFNGPKGIGFLYIKKGININPFMDGGFQENELRAGTENVAAIIGMAIALEKNYKKIVHFKNKMNDLEKLLLLELDNLNVKYFRNGALNHIPGNISLSFENFEGEVMLHRLDLAEICISTGSACDSVNTRISHVIKAMGLPDEYAKGTIRISLGKDNTQKEVRIIAETITDVLKKSK
jgi:cysteine desulfurase